jgi:hypothetical protein
VRGVTRRMRQLVDRLAHGERSAADEDAIVLAAIRN